MSLLSSNLLSSSTKLTGGAGAKVGDIVFSTKDLGANYLLANGPIVPTDATKVYDLLGNADTASNGASVKTNPVSDYGSGSVPILADSPTTGTIVIVNVLNRYRSTDDGVTFTKLSNFPERAYDGVGMPDGTLVFSTEDGSASNLYASTDDGLTFTSIVANLASSFTSWRAGNGHNDISGRLWVGGVLELGGALYAQVSYGTRGSAMVYALAKTTNMGGAWTFVQISRATGGDGPHFLYKVPTNYYGVIIVAMVRSFNGSNGQKNIVQVWDFNVGTGSGTLHGFGPSVATLPDLRRGVEPDNTGNGYIFILGQAGGYRWYKAAFNSSFTDIGNPTYFGNTYSTIEQRRMRDGGVLHGSVTISGSTYLVYISYLATADDPTIKSPRAIRVHTNVSNPAPQMPISIFPLRKTNSVILFIPNYSGEDDMRIEIHRLTPQKRIPVVPTAPSSGGLFYMKVK